ncbi:MAG: DUF4340 domain-containing protein [Gammaproteobacteria bacterium]|nr:DUF4340 domain-containing protein [Gammaproteobacteria bacterium]
MKFRPLITFIIASVVLVGAWRITQRKAPTGDVQTVELYPGFIDKINDVRSITVKNKDGAVTVARAGDRWTVRSLDDYPANVATVKQALVQLASLKIVDTKTSNAAKYAQIGVEDVTSPDARSRLVTVTGASTSPALLIGKERAAKSPMAPGHYVRRAGETNALLVEGELGFSAKASDWLDSTVADLSVDRVHQVTIKPHDGKPFTVQKANPQEQLYTLAEVPAGFEVRARATVSSIGGLLLDAKFERVMAASKLAGLTPRASAVVETFDGLIGTVDAYDVDKAVYMTLKFALQPAQAMAAPTTTTPKASGAAPAPANASALKKPADVTTEVEELNKRVAGWAYVLPDYKSRLLDKKIDDLIKKKESQPTASNSPK